MAPLGNPTLVRRAKDAGFEVIPRDIPSYSGLDFRRRQEGGAMRTAGCLDRNSIETEGAVSRHGDGFRLFALQPVHLPDEHEYREGDDQEITKGIEEDSVIDRGCARGFCLSQSGVGMSGEVDEFIRKIRVACEQANRGHQNVGNQGADNSPESRANNDAHCHIEHAAAHCEISELIEHPVAFLSQEDFRTAQVSHPEVFKNRVVSCRHEHTSALSAHAACHGSAMSSKEARFREICTRVCVPF